MGSVAFFVCLFVFFLHQYTHNCLNLFSFSCSEACFAIAGVISVPNATVLPAGPWRAGTAGALWHLEWVGVGASGTLLGKGKINEI